MGKRRQIRLLVAIGAAVLVSGLLAPPSHGAGAVVTTEQVPFTFFYDDIVTGDGSNTMILYAGATVAEECAGDLPTTTLRVRTRGEPPEPGSTIVERFVTRAPLYVYEGGGLDAAQFFDQVCETLAAGGEAPEPLATGAGVVRSRTNVAFGEAAPDATTVNCARGVVRTPDGKRWVVRGTAKLTLSPEFSVDDVTFEVRNRR